MIRNKIIRKAALALALTGILTTGVVNTNVCTADAQVQYESTFKIASFTGDYVTLNPTDYNLDCKNQGTVGKPIKFKTNIEGCATYLGCTYSFSNKAEAKPATVFGPTSTEYTWTPQTPGLYAVNVKCKDESGREQYATQYVEIHPEMKLDSFTSDHPYTDCELQAKMKLGETLNLNAAVSGGYGYTGKKYTYSMSPRNASENNRTVTYYNLPDSTLAWTPKFPGIYAINVDVTDEIGNTAHGYLYVMVQA